MIRTDQQPLALPLSGIRVLDLTQALAGPFATMMLGDMGADVLKIESPTGDMTRTTPPYYVGGTSVYFLSVNRNKRGLVLDLKNALGRSVLDDLVRQSDVFIANFGPGVAERLRITHSELSAVNPRIVSCDISGFGREGPDASRRAVDLIVQAMAGGISVTGETSDRPVKAGVPTADLSAGLFAAVGIMAALVMRSRTGRGVHVATSLFHSQLNLLSYLAAYYLHSHVIPRPLGSAHAGSVPSQVFATRDGFIAIDAGFDNHFLALCEAVGLRDIASDARFVDRKSRNANRTDLIRLLAAQLAARPTGDWLRTLDDAGVPCGPVNDVKEAIGSPQATHYGSVRRMRVESGEVDALATPVWFDGALDHPVSSPPRLGEHTVAVLRELLRYSDERVAELAERGAFGQCIPAGLTATKVSTTSSV